MPASLSVPRKVSLLDLWRLVKLGIVDALMACICYSYSSASFVLIDLLLFKMGVVGKEIGESLLTLMRTIKSTGMIQIMTVER